MIRLDKYLSDLGIATRKELRQIIRAGRVRINGTCADSPEQKLDPEADTVELDGNVLNYRRFRYFAMDKPTGVLTAATDKKQKTVLDLLPPELRSLGLFPVGRLDKDTSGLLLLTNDGEFAHQVISPKKEIEKVYAAVTDGTPNAADVKAFAGGITLRDGLHCLPAKLDLTGGNSCRVTVREGKYHQVRRMLAAVGKPVLELRRLSIGALALEEMDLADGICELSQTDLSKVLNAK